VLNIILIAFVPLARIFELALKYFQEAGLFFLGRLPIRRH